jgi:hypothetical protein
MISSPTALIISDYPIVLMAARAVFRHRYQVIARTWQAYAEQPLHDAELAVADVTTVPQPVALALLSQSIPHAGIAVCSMLHNEVEVYRLDSTGLRVERALPNLLALAK